MESSSASKTWPRTKKMPSSTASYHSCVQFSCRRTFFGLPGPRFAASGLFVGGEGRCVSTAQQQDCSATGLLSNRIAAESTEGREARLKQLKTAKHFQVYMSVRSVSTSSTQSECLRCTRDKYSSANNMNLGVVCHEKNGPP